MRLKKSETSIWALGSAFCATFCFADSANPAPTLLRVEQVTHYWPWLAFAGILLLLAVIARAARRDLPFGPRL